MEEFCRLELQSRLQLKKIHKILEFKQEPFLKPYIERNTDLPREAEKKCYKIKKQKAQLRNNAIFGKWIENPMNKADVKIVATRKQYFQWAFRPNFKRAKQFRNGALANEKEKCKINLEKPISIGMSILDLREVLIADFDYNYIKNMYDNKTEMLLTDNDIKLKLKMFMKSFTKLKSYLT